MTTLKTAVWQTMSSLRTADVFPVVASLPPNTSAVRRLNYERPVLYEFQESTRSFSLILHSKKNDSS